MNKSRYIQKNCIRWQISASLQKQKNKNPKTSTTEVKSFVVRLRVIIRKRKKISKEMRKEQFFQSSVF